MDNKEKEKIIEENMGLVVSIANKFNPSQDEKTEYIHLGTIGLWKALERFKPELGFKLSTFAWYYIRAEIQTHIDKFKAKDAVYCHLYDNNDSYIPESEVYDYLPDSLSKREIQIVTMRLYESMTFQEISDKLGNCTKSWVAREYKRAIRKIKNANR
jgi:RNA polymerase sigma factor (sigma-70 family)